ncbi:MAG: outer membrane beta-barrel protein [Nitrospira sp.]|nr:outer membrane beta-barrel protein [Nitrospira sp.]
MNQIQRVVQHLAFSAILLGGATTTQVSATYAETYIAGQFGVTLPNIPWKGLSDGDLTNSSVAFPTGTVNIPSGTTVDDQSLQQSFLYGGKIGHYFSKVRWFGIEAEIFYSTPHLKQQSITFRTSAPTTFLPSGGGPPVTVPPGEFSTAGQIPGANFHVLTIAPLNLMFRYPGTRLQPYLGFGPGIFIARIKDPSISQGDNSQSSTKLGLNALVGLRYYFTRNLAIFAEGKFNYVRFSFDENTNFFGFDATYAPIHAVGGLSVHF